MHNPGYAYYQGADLALQAAVLAHGIAETQPFLDGNKRTAALAMLAFLDRNGYTLDVPQRTLIDWLLQIARGWPPAALATELRAALGLPEPESSENTSA